MIFLFLFLLVLSFYFYFDKRPGEVCFCLTAIATNCFSFVETGNGLKPTDLVLVFILIISVIELFFDRNYFKVKKDPIGLILLLLVCYYFLSLLFTVTLNIEGISNAFKTMRSNLVLLLYFYIRKSNFNSLLRFYKLLLIASIVQGVFFYLQVIGVDGILSGRVDEGNSNDAMTRYANFPQYAPFFILYFIIGNRTSIRKKLFYIIFFGMMLVLGQMRGIIIAVTISVVVFFALKRKIEYATYMVAGFLAYSFIIAPMFEYRTRNSQQNTSEEIVKVATDPTSIYRDYTAGNTSGNFAFRIAMLMERVYYIGDHPKHIPFGVGCIHEESSNNRYFFYLGTRNDRAKFGYSTLGSADIAWVGVLMRYGIVAVTFYLLLFFYWAKRSVPQISKDCNALFIASALMSIYSFLISFDGDNLGRIPGIIALTIYLSLIYVFKKNNYVLSNHRMG